MSKLGDAKIVAEIGQILANTASTVFDRIKKIKDMGERITKLESDVKELKEKK